MAQRDPSKVQALLADRLARLNENHTINNDNQVLGEIKALRSLVTDRLERVQDSVDQINVRLEKTEQASKKQVFESYVPKDQVRKSYFSKEQILKEQDLKDDASNTQVSKGNAVKVQKAKERISGEQVITKAGSEQASATAPDAAHQRCQLLAKAHNDAARAYNAKIGSSVQNLRPLVTSLNEPIPDFPESYHSFLWLNEDKVDRLLTALGDSVYGPEQIKRMRLKELIGLIWKA